MRNTGTDIDLVPRNQICKHYGQDGNQTSGSGLCNVLQAPEGKTYTPKVFSALKTQVPQQAKEVWCIPKFR